MNIVNDPPSVAFPGQANTFRRINPLTGEVASEAPAMSTAEVEQAAALAAAAFPGWSALGPNMRRKILNQAADELEARADVLVAAMMAEVGSTEGWARFNVSLGANHIREAAALTTQINGEVIPSDKPGCFAFASREPVGVIVGIAPWNAPIILGVRAIATPLACGNTVVFKASEQCPRTHMLVAEAFGASGAPEGTVCLVTNAPDDAPDIVGALVDHPKVRRINFTGSTRVGRIIAKRAAEHLKPCLLELGGKAPLVVLEDADLDEAVKAAAFGAFMNQGQICMSTEKIIVVASIADEFAKRFAVKASGLLASDPRSGGTVLGSVVDEHTIVSVQSLIADAVSKGAKLLVGSPPTGTLMSAHVVDYVRSGMRLFSEESFGPVVAIVRARDEDHAVELANDGEYGLSAAIFTRDAARGLRIARKIRSGICHINGPTVHDEPQMPFGGMGLSGYGRFGGKAGIDAFTEIRWITIETEPGHFPL